MKQPQLISGISGIGRRPRHLHLAVGMFDGVHLGHRAVIEAAVQSALRTGGEAGVLTFWPHPSALFAPERRSRMLMGPEAKYRVLGRLGVDFIITQPFTNEFARNSPADFIRLLRESMPALEAIYVGENWRFGSGRSGDVSALLALAAGQGISVFSAPRVHFNGEPVSSSRIRTCLASGDLGQANAMLGYSYFAEGRAQPGRRLGRTLGFPTLNLAWEPELLPAFGVYAVRVAAAGSEQWHPAVANYGVRPTVESQGRPLLEAHLLGPCPFDEGDELCVEWVRFLRPEQRFPGLEALKAQIEKDCLQARAEFSLQG